ncbi:MAG TPA: hypothetical protein VFO31_10180 [Vicinamibacterales bacterium]|nr:hypothetical protein [Vicinamibacterales bacterium]
MCASERYAFLSQWLPSEERRRWRRTAPKDTPRQQGALYELKRFFSRWFGEGDPEPGYRGIKTRASYRLPNLSFEAPVKEPPKQPLPTREPIKNDG